MEQNDLDEIIKVDLHIHSIKSKYKEKKIIKGMVDRNIVDDSTIDNLPILLDKLEENHINLFGFSDHNKFDKDLFNKAKELVSKGHFKYVKAILPSVEFDVQLEENHPSCHIITVFDYKNEEDLKRIAEINDNGIIKDENSFYTITDFERMMKKIGLGTLFIACQRKSINNLNRGSNCASDSVSNLYEFLKTGFISALEYQKPQVEGILKNDLVDFPGEISFVAGSDCHQWSEYPYHDSSDKPKNHSYYFEIKSRPTFLVLLLAFTSPNSRFNRHLNKKVGLLNSFSIAKKTFPVSKGINAIIGENGSGKSTLLSGLAHVSKEKNYMKSILHNNDFTSDPSIIEVKSKVLLQNELINNDCGEGTIFGSDAKFKILSHTEFKTSVDLFADMIWKEIQLNIKLFQQRSEITNTNFEIKTELENRGKYFVNLIKENKTEFFNEAKERLINLNLILNKIKVEIENNFYNSEDRIKFKKAFDILYSIRNKTKDNYKYTNAYNNIMGIIINRINTYNSEIEKLVSSEEKRTQDYSQTKASFRDCIINMCKTIQEKSKIDLSSVKIDVSSGQDSKQVGEFQFLTTAEYFEKSSEQVKNELLEDVFNKGYQTINEIQKINTESILRSAICRPQSDLAQTFNNNKDKFVQDLSKVTKSVICPTESKKNILGFTLGQKSIMYYRYITYFENGVCLLFIDQPEDNLSNRNVLFKLRDYLNKLRKDDVQIFLVTHNPMLVINLDVDNVISCHLNNGKMNIISGPLEGEGVLKEIMDEMDGSKEEIEKRLKLYENN